MRGHEKWSLGFFRQLLALSCGMYVVNAWKGTAVKRAQFKGLTFKLLWATKTEFLLIKSLHYQADKWWEYNPWITIFDDDICRCPQYVKRLTLWMLICIRIATFLKSRYLHHTDLHWHVRKRHRGGIVLSLSI